MASFLGGAMRALASSEKTRKFFDTKRYSDLPDNWASDPEIVRMAHDAWEDAGIQSPFFKAYFGNSKIVGPYGDPLPIYTGTRLAGLQVIDPAMSVYAQKHGIPGSSFGSSKPGVAYTYQLRPGPDLADPVYQDVMGSASRVLNGGGGLLVSGLERPFTRQDGDVKTLSALLNHIDTSVNLNYLDELPRPRTGYHLPEEDLASLSTFRPAHQLFVAENAEDLGIRNPETFQIFSKPLGEVHPLYIHAERPVIANSVPGVRDWTQLADMRVDKSSLFPDELAALQARGGSSVADAFPDAQWRVYADKHVIQPTDEFAGHLARYTDHDALLMRNVVDGANGLVPSSDVVAWLKPWQAKSAYNWGTFNPWDPSIYRAAGPVAVGGGALAAAMGAPSSASASVLPDGWVPPSAKAELQGMEPSGWMDPVNWLVDAATAGGGLAFRTGQAALGAAQDWIGEHVPPLPEVPEDHYEAAQ